MAWHELNPDLVAELEAAVDRFESAWQLGERPSIRNFCTIEGSHAVSLLKELVLVDCEYRLKAGEPRGADDYVREFPELRTDQDLIFNLLKLESRSDRRESAPLNGDGDRVAKTPQPTSHASSPVSVQPLTDSGSTVRIPADGSTLPRPKEAGSPDLARSSTAEFPRRPAAETGTQEVGLELGLGRFRLLEMIGQGSFGTVYRAMDMKLGRFVAVKLPRREILGTEAETERFLREARSAAGLSHQNIVPVYEVGGANDRPFIVSAFIEGRTLADELAVRRFEFRDAARIVRKVADALHYAHLRKRIVHRDVKPSNIMLGSDGEPFLMDFGVAKRDGDGVLTIAGQLVGTPAYMSPEQAAGGGVTVNARSDVYSLGVVLYELLTGERPFQGSVQSILLQVAQVEPRPPKSADRRVPKDLMKICLQCLQKSPADRYQTAGDLCDDLDRFLRGETVRARQISPPARLWRLTRRRPKTAALVGTVFALATTLSVVWYEAHSSARQANVIARQAEVTSRRRLESLWIEKGNVFLDAGDPMRAVPWFEAVNERAADPLRQSAQRTRVITTLRQAPQPVWCHVHSGSIVSVAHSPTQHLLAVADTNKTVTIYDLSKPKDPGHILQHPAVLRQCVFSTDGTRLATSCLTGPIRIWRTTDWSKPLLVLEQDKRPRWMAFDPSGRYLASGCLAGGVRIWEVASGKPYATDFDPHADVEHLAFNADGSLLAVAATDGTVRLWSAATHKWTVGPFVHPKPVTRVCFTTNGRSVISADADGAVCVWDAATGAPQDSFQTRSLVTDVSVDPTGTLLAAGCRNGAVEVRNLKTHRAMPGKWHHGDAVGYLSFASNGQFLVTASYDSTARVWDTKTGEPVAPPVFIGGTVIWAELSDDGRQITTAGYDCMVRLWEFGNPFSAEHGSPHGGRVVKAQLNANERWLCLGRSHGPAELCDLDDPRLSSTLIGTSSGAHNQAFSPDGLRLVTTNDRGDLDVWDISSPHPYVLREIHTEAGPPIDVAFSPDGGRILASGLDGVARVYSLTGDTPPLVLPHGSRLIRASFAGDGQKIYTAGGQTVTAWVGAAGTSLPTLKDIYQLDDFRLMPGDSFLVLAGNQATIRNIETGAIKYTLRHPSGVATTVLSRDGSRLVTAGHDKAAHVWDTTTGLPVTDSLPHLQEVTCCAISPDRLLVATGSADETARVWDAVTGQPVSPPLRHTDGVIFVAFRKGGKELVSVSADSLVRKWTLDDGTPTDRLLRLARVTSGQTIDADGLPRALHAAEIKEEMDALRNETPSASH